MLTSTLIIALLCLLSSAFFSLSETAITGSTKTLIIRQASLGSKKAQMLEKLLNQPNNVITLLLVGNNVANIFFTAFLTNWFITNYGENYIFFLGLVLAIIVLVIAEILPKTYAFSNPTGIALFICPIIYAFVVIFNPIAYLFLKINSFILFYILRIKKTGGNNNLFASVDNLRGAIEMLERNEETTTSEEKAMLHGILDLNEITVSDILNHRKNVFCLDIEEPYETNLEAILNCEYTRVPVYRDSTENIIGILNIKNFYKEYHKNNKVDIESILNEPYFVPESTDVIDLLMTFRNTKQRMAIVVDEYGSFMGILTLGDILEEITGDLSSKEDSPENILSYQDSIIVPGDLKIRDLNRKMNWKISDEDFTTVAGLILYVTGKIPLVGNSFNIHGFNFEVIEKRKHQLSKIRITKNN